MKVQSLNRAGLEMMRPLRVTVLLASPGAGRAGTMQPPLVPGWGKAPSHETPPGWEALPLLVWLLPESGTGSGRRVRRVAAGLSPDVDFRMATGVVGPWSSGPRLLAAGTGPRLLAAGTGLRLLAAGTGPRLLAAGTGPRLLAAGTGPRLLAAGTGPRLLAAGT